MKNTLSSHLRIGGHTFASTALLTATIAALAWFFSGWLTFVFGTGWIAPMLLSFVVVLVLLLFKNLIINHLHPKASPDGEAELIEYLVRENYTGHPDEEKIETELLENALHLKQVKVRDCMTPRREIVAIDSRSGMAELQTLFTESYLSRILVTDGDLDKILGYVHVQQLFSKPENIRPIVLPVFFVPETMQVNDLIQKFIRTHSSMACVVDEYGSTSGLVTIEDALEQLFGDIDDEHDQQDLVETQISEREFLFSGRLEIDYLNEKFPALNLPKGDYQTLSGYLVAAAQTIPEQGVRLELDGKVFVLDLVSDRKIETVRVFL